MSPTIPELVYERNILREFYKAWWVVEQGVVDFDLHAESVTRLSEAHAAVINFDRTASDISMVEYGPDDDFTDCRDGDSLAKGET